MTMVLSKFSRYTITFVAGMGSLLGGAAIVHNVFLPDITIPVRKPTTPTIEKK